ncbi:prolyl-tRNA synthetase associated domain-containing protein [Streptococcus pacificus]|uniref:Prolyl-tRNA synthetase associated domain-containing protein n=1 Tax=Streptococcus pacificus TaxID=2740577 RepID=A0ABS0ZHK3_9STRE|nr:prolyl-tRNA synthetase associated domain-containing protein [Streptococcus pacificus]MBJ8325477.1 prolyl-tRNA synthetase associated domain-containing protein [Streptococcus pacificus]
MTLYQELITKLDSLKLPYDIVSHEPALTTEQADSFIEGIEGVRTKTLFLTNKKKTAFYLVVMDDQKRLNLDHFKEIIQEKRIKLASEQLIDEKTSLEPGVVSPFGLLFNKEHDIRVYFDREIMSEKIMSFHPTINTKTLFIATKDLLTFIEHLGNPVEIIDL